MGLLCSPALCQEWQEASGVNVKVKLKMQGGKKEEKPLVVIVVCVG